MSDEERKKSAEGPKGSGGALDVIGRIGEGVIDGLAAQKPIIGMPLQAAFNTEEYQDRQLRRQAARERLARERAENEEWTQGASLRQKQRQNAETAADEWAAGAGDRADQRKFDQERRDAARAKIAHESKVMSEWDAGSDVRAQQRDAEFSRARLAQEQADALYKRQVMSNYADGLRKDLAGNPAFGMMSYAEQDELITSPQMQNLFDARFYTDQVMSIGKNDRRAFDYMDRVLRRQGWSLVDGEGGIKYLDMGGFGRLPATKDAIDLVNKRIANAALEELDTRSKISDAATMGDPVKRSIAERTKALMPYNGNDATKSYKMLQEIYDKASEPEKGWHMFHQAITDYRSSGLPQQAKMNGLAVCLNFLPKMGYSVEGIDPKNPDIGKATIIDLKNHRRMSFDEFAEICKANDSLGSRLDMTIGMKQYSYIQQAAGRTVANAEARRMVNPPSTTSAKGKKSEKTDVTPEQTVVDEGEQISGDLSAAFGSKYEELPEKKRKALVNAKKEWNTDKSEILMRYGVESVSKLPDDALKKLNNSWIKLIGDADLSEKDFYSPVDSLLLERENARIHQEISSEYDPRGDERIQNLLEGGRGFWGSVGAERVIAESDDKGRTGREKIAQNQETLRNRGHKPTEYDTRRKQIPSAQVYINGQPVHAIPAADPHRKRRTKEEVEAALKKKREGQK